jgi:hypothetical protein
MTNKQIIKTADPSARLDYYEFKRGLGQPCWFIRSGFQGPARSAICASPKLAWKDAADRFRKQFPKLFRRAA